jgi:hypothetical protein
MNVKTMRLTTNMRVLRCTEPNNASILSAFAEYLLQVGDGTLGVDDIIEIDNNMLIFGSCFATFCDSIFPSFESNYLNVDYFTSRAILTPLHTGVKFINDFLYNKLPASNEKIYYSEDTLLDDDDVDYYPVEVLNSLDIGNMPPHELRVKVGCPLMLLRNLDPKNGLCNGTRLICRSFSQNVIKVDIVSGSHKGLPTLIPRIKLSPNQTAFPVPFIRKQFPVTLAFGLTINKAQGQTLSTVGIYLPEPVFSHGQMYVAMSRVGNPSAIKFFFVKNLPYGQTSYTTKNVVYKEVYQR